MPVCHSAGSAGVNYNYNCVCVSVVCNCWSHLHVYLHIFIQVCRVTAMSLIFMMKPWNVLLLVMSQSKPGKAWECVAIGCVSPFML